MLAAMPGWVTSARVDGPEDAAFLSGAALSYLHLVACNRAVPHALWRDRLALRAALACAKFAGRREGSAELRDEVHLLGPGGAPGPAGALLAQWRAAAAAGLSLPPRRLVRILVPEHMGEAALPLLSGFRRCGTPVAAAADALGTLLPRFPREEAAALILAEAVLARACGWDRLVPLLAAGLTSRDLRREGEALRAACHRAIVASAVEAVRLSAELARGAARLRAVAPKLRAKGAGAAVEMFLSRDAVAPAALTGAMSDRAARRLCDRLVSLGAVRELTGRSSFRLYGV